MFEFGLAVEDCMGGRQRVLGAITRLQGTEGGGDLGPAVTFLRHVGFADSHRKCMKKAHAGRH
jgi:hypothetical protein